MRRNTQNQCSIELLTAGGTQGTIYGPTAACLTFTERKSSTVMVHWTDRTEGGSPVSAHHSPALSHTSLIQNEAAMAGFLGGPVVIFLLLFLIILFLLFLLLFLLGLFLLLTARCTPPLLLYLQGQGGWETSVLNSPNPDSMLSIPKSDLSSTWPITGPSAL